MMGAVITTETMADFYQTVRLNIQDRSHLYTHCLENLKFYQVQERVY
jgi:hypothetical protein